MPNKNDKNSNFFGMVLQIIEYYDIKNVNDFALNYLEYKSSQKINRLKDSNTNPSFEILNDISNKFEQINVEWLLNGKGDMIKQSYQLNKDARTVAEPSVEYQKAGYIKEYIDSLKSNIESLKSNIDLKDSIIDKLEAIIKEKDEVIEGLKSGDIVYVDRKKGVS